VRGWARGDDGDVGLAVEAQRRDAPDGLFLIVDVEDDGLSLANVRRFGTPRPAGGGRDSEARVLAFVVDRPVVRRAVPVAGPGDQRDVEGSLFSSVNESRHLLRMAE
jgi:hypothetical protein